jgi:plastocyanin
MTTTVTRQRTWGAAALLAAWLAGARPGAAATTARDSAPPPAAGASEPGPADFARLQGEVRRLAEEVREQRQLILQLMQMHDALLKYVQLGAGAPGAATPNAPSGELGAPFGADARGVGPGTAGRAGGAALGPAAGQPGGTWAGAQGGPGQTVTRAPVSGKVLHPSGPIGEAYVYLDGPRIAAEHAPTVVVKQVAKRFVPTVAVVQMGGRVAFPNADKFLHNVFSSTPGDAFDLGPVLAGEKSEPVVMLKPGHVEVFCNIHSQMRADVLVTPNGWFTRVRADGTFQLSGVPLGAQRIALWGPDLKPVSQRVEVSPGGTSLTFQAEPSPPRRAHLNKQGGAYESYER